MTPRVAFRTPWSPHLSHFCKIGLTNQLVHDGVHGRHTVTWAGYDELNVNEVQAVLSEGDDQRRKDVRAYERRHKARAGVIQATETELSNA